MESEGEHIEYLDVEYSTLVHSTLILMEDPNTPEGSHIPGAIPNCQSIIDRRLVITVASVTGAQRTFEKVKKAATIQKGAGSKRKRGKDTSDTSDMSEDEQPTCQKGKYGRWYRHEFSGQ